MMGGSALLLHCTFSAYRYDVSSFSRDIEAAKYLIGMQQ